MQIQPGLVLNQVRKAFRDLVAVDDLTFTVPRGSMFGLLGANGAGKTTTLRMILNIITPDQGTIEWNGHDVARLPRNTFGYLPEERGLYPKMRTGEQLVFLASLNEVPGHEATVRARDWLGRLGLADAWNRKVEELSKGNQQKVQVLAAILHNPDLMLLDEPFSGLDPINTEVLQDTLFRRQMEGHTIVFSSHRLEQVEDLCDHVAIIHKGGLLKAGPISEVKRSTGRRFVEVAFEGNGSGHPPDVRPFLSALAPYQLTVAEERAGSARLELLDGTTSDQVLASALQNGPGPVRRFEVVEPTLQEVFLAAIAQADPDAVEQLKAEGALPLAAHPVQANRELT